MLVKKPYLEKAAFCKERHHRNAQKGQKKNDKQQSLVCGVFYISL